MEARGHPTDIVVPVIDLAIRSRIGAGESKRVSRQPGELEFATPGVDLAGILQDRATRADRYNLQVLYIGLVQRHVQAQRLLRKLDLQAKFDSLRCFRVKYVIKRRIDPLCIGTG